MRHRWKLFALQTVKHSYLAMKRWLEHIAGYLRESLLVKDVYGDWRVPPESPFLIHSQDPARTTERCFHIVPGAERPRLRASLVRNIREQTEDHLGVGLVGAQWPLHTLSDDGFADLAYTIATKESFLVGATWWKKGATTIWELWTGDTADLSMNSGIIQRRRLMCPQNRAICLPSLPAFSEEAAVFNVASGKYILHSRL